MSKEVIAEEIKYKLQNKYKDYYKYETHLHTSQGSACGKNTGREMAIACKEYGYNGIIVTDHFFYGNTKIDRSLGWSDWVEAYSQGYYDAKEEGDKIGLNVFFGWESCYDAMEFLNYGPTPEWLKNHPEIRDCSVKEQYELVHNAGGLVIQAHPFREADYIHKLIQYPDDVDGAETLNISNGVKSGFGPYRCPWDDKAEEYADKYNLLKTAGSDIHSTDIFGCGMAFEYELKSIEDFIQAVRDRAGIFIE